MTLRRTKIAAVAAAAILALTSVAAMSQTAGGPGHPHGHGGMDVEHLLQGVKGQLNLNTSQQLAWDNAVAQTKAARVTGQANGQQLHDAVTAELTKAEPDLAAVAAVADGVQAANQSLRQTVRAQWLQLYATFSPQQKAVVRDALAKRVARMESFGAKMREHMQSGG